MPNTPDPNTPDEGARPARLGIVTMSDRASRGEYPDRTTPAIQAYLDEVLTSPREFHTRLIPDDQPLIEDTLRTLADDVGCDLIITSGGTGPAPRDVTPEVTASLCSRMLPGFGEAMRMTSLPKVPTAILSRGQAGIRGACLIINLPGSPKAIRECLDAVFGAVPDCIDQIGGARLETDPERVWAYRPH